MSEKKKHPGGRPRRTDIPKEQILDLYERHWTTEAIAHHFKCDTTTIMRRVTHEEIAKCRAARPAKLLDAIYQRGMGGRTVRKNEDGSETVVYLKSSDRMARLAADYFLGKPKQVVELNPSPERPAHVSITDETMAKALAKFEEEY